MILYWFLSLSSYQTGFLNSHCVWINSRGNQVIKQLFHWNVKFCSPHLLPPVSCIWVLLWPLNTFSDIFLFFTTLVSYDHCQHFKLCYSCRCNIHQWIATVCPVFSWQFFGNELVEAESLLFVSQTEVNFIESNKEMATNCVFATGWW